MIARLPTVYLVLGRVVGVGGVRLIRGDEHRLADGVLELGLRAARRELQGGDTVISLETSRSPHASATSVNIRFILAFFL